MIVPDAKEPFWTRGKDALCAELGCATAGLGAIEAVARFKQYGPNVDAVAKHASVAGAVVRRLLEPLYLIVRNGGPHAIQ